VKKIHYIILAIVIASMLSAATIPFLMEERSSNRGGSNQPHAPSDTIPPKISLERPKNRSFILPGTEIEFNVSDNNMKYVRFCVDGIVVNITNFTVDTSSWKEGAHRVSVYAEDIFNNSAKAWFEFIIDLTAPEIDLVSPPNSSAMESGTPILLNISDEHLVGANYTLDDGQPQCLPKPFIISTDWWTEGTHRLKICALDKAGNKNTTYFDFTIDNMETDIKVLSPNTRVIRSGTPIVFDIEDSTLKNISYSINGGIPVMWESPWIISTDNWTDGVYSITIQARDKAGHSVVRTYGFWIDDTPPVIKIPDDINITIYTYTDIRNYSFWENYRPMNLTIKDEHLKDVLYSVNGGAYERMKSPYILDPSRWRGKVVKISVKAIDVVGNTAEVNFSVNLTFHMTIYMGSNVSTICIPLNLSNYSIKYVFSQIYNTENGSYDKIEGYDGAWHTYDPNRPPQFNMWKEFSPYCGLLIDITTKTANFSISGSLIYDININLSSNHANLVSYPFMHSMRVDRALSHIPWYRVQRWDWETQRYIDMKGDDIMIPGYAYWIYVSYDSIWQTSFGE
jgi:hypothetical protein